MTKISFKELYDALDGLPNPKQKFRREIAKVTGKKEQTIKQWLSGSQMPTTESIRRIADHFGVDPSGLFPEINHKQRII